MAHQNMLASLHVSNEMQAALMASLPEQQPINEEGPTPHTPSFLSTAECCRLEL